MPNTKMQNGGFFPRFVAQMIDTLLLALPEFIALYFVFQVSSWSEVISRSIAAITFVVMPMWLVRIVYYMYFISRKGKTIGKASLGLEIVGEKNKNITAWWALFRETIGKSISSFIFGLGFLWIIKDKNNLAWHDYLAGTNVRKKEDRTMLGIMILLILLFIHISLYYNISSSVLHNSSLVEEALYYVALFS